MSDLVNVDAARLRLAQVETVEDANDLVDELDRLREYGRLIDAAPSQINAVTLVKVETRAKRADLVDAGQESGLFRKRGRPSKKPDGAQALPVADYDLSNDRVLRDGLSDIRRMIADSDVEVIDRQLLEAARRRRAQETDRAARVIDNDDEVDDDVYDDRRGERWALLAGDMRDRLGDLDPHSVDLIVTDPPYPREFLPLWSDLAQHAARVLVPGGIMVALSGKIMFDEVIARCAEHLAWGWCYCQPLPGPSSRILGRHVGQEWKPWLAFSNGAWPSGRVDWHGDMLHGVPAMKDRYHWEQSEAPAGELIVRLSPDNGVVLDPFTGTGTYGLAALRAGRRFVGVEQDSGRRDQAAQRLAEL